MMIIAREPDKSAGSSTTGGPRTWKSGGVNWPPGPRGSAAPDLSDKSKILSLVHHTESLSYIISSAST